MIRKITVAVLVCLVFAGCSYKKQLAILHVEKDVWTAPALGDQSNEHVRFVFKLNLGN